jgi:hypothetical protein
MLNLKRVPHGNLLSTAWNYSSLHWMYAVRQALHN